MQMPTLPTPAKPLVVPQLEIRVLQQTQALRLLITLIFRKKTLLLELNSLQ
jgi:hypothetical protein